jgi:xanthine dehydrogenase YagT iron-sulfur-binding subunit
MQDDSDETVGGLNRREVIVGVTVIPATLSLSGQVTAQTTPPSDLPIARLEFQVNGRPVAATIDARSSALDLLREQLNLTGTKKCCDHGQCGACTVHLDGRRILSCLTPAMQLQGRVVTTIEGLGGSGLHPMQQAFIENDALQCGYCTPGQIMSAVACVAEGHASSEAEIREYMSGNLCRCGAYNGIVAAIEQVARRERGS